VFYDNYLRLCIKNHVSPTGAALDIGISKPSVNRWKNGATPTDATLLRIADYFGVTVAELLENKEKPTPENGSGQVSPATAELLDLIADLNEEQVRRLEGIVRAAKDLL
jgi:transcriptional regulator with XRE-family HTH domain